ncbi:hypothetical protein VTN00DRAFT_8382 [Thermoascus crustaceus]|uniref:uncharacterized protein n=1 Tax=Thermoascus crustaceus TaxID=5088 RepID=UPI003743203D
MNGHETVVQLLLEKGVDADYKDKYGRTPFMWAAARQQVEVVELLLSKTTIDPNSKDKFGRTALLAAAIGGHVAVVKLLLTKNNIDSNIQDIFGRTPLLDAKRIGNLDVVRLLLNEYNKTGTPIHGEELYIKAHSWQHQGRIYCDICLVNIPDINTHHHCHICENGDFDICQKCIESGAFCLDHSHKLVKRVVKDGGLIEVPD